MSPPKRPRPDDPGESLNRAVSVAAGPLTGFAVVTRYSGTELGVTEALGEAFAC